MSERRHTDTAEPMYGIAPDSDGGYPSSGPYYLRERDNGDYVAEIDGCEPSMPSRIAECLSAMDGVSDPAAYMEAVAKLIEAARQCRYHWHTTTSGPLESADYARARADVADALAALEPKP